MKFTFTDTQKNMLNAIQQQLTIPTDGLLTIRYPKLKPGLPVQVIVLFQDSSFAPEQEPYDEIQPMPLWLDSAAANKERMTFTYQKKVFLAVVPIEDVEVIKQLKNTIGNEYSKKH